LDGTGSATDVDLSCASLNGGPLIDPNDGSSLAIDYASGNLYAFLEYAFDGIGWFVGKASLDGSGCVQAAAPASGVGQARGSAFDPISSRLYLMTSLAGQAYVGDFSASLPLTQPLPLVTFDPAANAGVPRYPSIVKPPKVSSAAVSSSTSEPGASLSLSGAAVIDDEVTMRVYRGAA